MESGESGKESLKRWDLHAGMASGLKRRFDDDDDLSHITLRSMFKYRLVMTSMIWMRWK